VTSVGENEEKANTIQPPFLCFSHLQYHVVSVEFREDGEKVQGVYIPKWGIHKKG